MSDAKSISTNDSQNSQNQTVLLDPTQFDAIVTAMLPALQTMIRSAMSDTMTVKDFAAVLASVWSGNGSMRESFSKLRPKTFPTKRKLLNEAEPS